MSDEMQTPNTSNSDSNATTIGGNVTTGKDFVGRDLTVQGDTIDGDKVAGDKISAGDRGVAAKQIVGSTLITGDYATINYPRLDLTDARNQRNHATMRQLVRKFWIDGVLKSSLYNEVLIRLNLTEQLKAVDNRPWDLIRQQPGKPNYALPAGTPIIDVFDQMNQRLLILGEPGSGKTTMLLELADALLKRAEADPMHPTPIVFNLSSWAEKRQPLTEWLVEELRIRYDIPKKVAHAWIENGELLPLLDGLDEVKQEYRSACAEVINQFRQRHFIPLVVCSRWAEYEELATQLRLQGAVMVKPLTLAQINEYLRLVGDELSAVRLTLQEDAELQEIATTPLMLNVMTMAYHGIAIEDISANGTSSSRRQHLFDAYLKRIFTYRENRHPYPVWKTIHWLSWLAGQLTANGQTIFLVERIQPYWLSVPLQKLIYVVVDRFGWALIFGICFGAVAGLVYPNSDLFRYGMLHGMAVGLFGGAFQTEQRPIRQLAFDLAIGVGITLLVALQIEMIRGALFGRESLFEIPNSSSSVSVFIYLFLVSLVGRPTQIIRQVAVIERPKWSYSKSLRTAMGIAMVSIVFYVLVVAILLFLIVMTDGYWSALFALLYAHDNTNYHSILIQLLLLAICFAVIGGLISSNIISTKTFNEGIWRSFRNATTLGATIGIIVGVVMEFTMAESMTSKLASVTLNALSFGLCGWLAFGGYAVLSHIGLRVVLLLNQAIPVNYSHFLNYCHNHLLLRKVGGGYIFIHRMLMEHFASLTDDDIKRIAASVEESRK